ncbi:ROK family transcriptional regulator [Candidatus Bipolaricaulota bacterium]|nr:ROK family transcriptional regulator [Candidatus Bipolaricaulota bacterium]
MSKKRKQGGLNAQSIGLHNTQKVLELIRERGSISRVEIADYLDLSKAAITSAVDRLLEKGFLKEEEDTEHEKVGPKPQLISVKPNAALFLGVDVGGTSIGYGIGNLQGEITEQRKLKTCDGWEDVVQQIIRIFENRNQWHEHDQGLVQAIGVSVPGVVDQKGNVSFAPNIEGPENFPIRERLEENVPVPVFVENDVNLSALGEMNIEAIRYTDLVFVSIGTGLGVGIIIDGELYHGAFQHAGEIGWMIIDREDLSFEADGPQGSLETKLTGPSLVRRAREAVDNCVDSFDGIGPEEITPEKVLGLRKDYPALEKVFNDWVEEWSIVLNNLTAILDPQLIVLGGGVSQSLDDETVERLRANIKSTTQRPPKVLLSPDPEKAPLRGATELCLAEFDQWFS